jgi:FkbM family methyltransferase
LILYHYKLQEKFMGHGKHIKWSRLLRGKLRSLGLRKHGIGVVARTRQGLFVVDPKDFGVGRALLDKGSYDTDVINSLLEYTTSDSTVVFVGAHIGALLVPMAAKVGKVIAFEPNPPTFEMLQLNVALNGLQNVELHKLAASAVEEELAIIHNTINTGGSSVQRSADQGDSTIHAAPIDSVIGDQTVDLMVVDAEGFEVEVYRGGQKVLKNTQFLYTEYVPSMLRAHGHSAGDFVETLQDHFKLMRIGEEGKWWTSNEWLGELQKLPDSNFLVNLTFMKSDPSTS